MRLWLAIGLLAGFAWGDSLPTVNEIVQRSVAKNNADWQAAPRYTYTEQDVISKDGAKSSKTYQVLMIEGSPYNKLLAVNGEPLSAAQVAAQERKLQKEIARRKKESPEERRKRIADYARGRRQDHALMTEMVKAFDFRLVGQETVDGHNCYVLDATPHPGYQPPSRETTVLTGMRGKMWIDTEQYQWVKVHASVFRPVAFGLFIAHVEPGTEFTLKEQPVNGDIWLPSSLETRVRAKILYFWSHNSNETDTFSNYRLQ